MSLYEFVYRNQNHLHIIVCLPYFSGNCPLSCKHTIQFDNYAFHYGSFV